MSKSHQVASRRLPCDAAQRPPTIGAYYPLMNHADGTNRRVRHRSSNETRPNDCSAHAKGSDRTTMTTRFLRNGMGNNRLCHHDDSPQSEYTDSKAAGVVGNPSVKCSNNGDEGLPARIVFPPSSGP